MTSHHKSLQFERLDVCGLKKREKWQILLQVFPSKRPFVKILPVKIYMLPFLLCSILSTLLITVRVYADKYYDYQNEKNNLIN